MSSSAPDPRRDALRTADPAPDQGKATRQADPATMRRAPRLGRFILAGILLGALLAFALSFLPGTGDLARSDLFWLLFLSTGLAGAFLGALAHLWADRRSMRRPPSSRA